jgi:hypothetical protein
MRTISLPGSAYAKYTPWYPSKPGSYPRSRGYISEPPPPPSKPQAQQGQFPLDLVVFNNTQANFFLNNPQWVHPGDKFMIVSANAFSGDNEDYNSSFVNNTARQLLARFPQTEVLATSS